MIGFVVIALIAVLVSQSTVSYDCEPGNDDGASHIGEQGYIREHYDSIIYRSAGIRKIRLANLA
ncbi:hypothetical protein TcasGA2_TC032175 [Tribolium castaneum]|uniref:Uncharacterized protein n=1 Tax=Tribolium castaneum TaxID=7070 RepID=A0A139WN22_TRICA|nr:hypothetical protein TcasGA2_TC032175 [Tribolium castaneum]